MKKFLLMVAVAATMVLADSQWASAGRGGCGGGCGGGRRGGHHGGCGGCGGGYCGGGGCGGGYYGGCGGCGGGYMMGCGGCGGGYTMGGCGGCGGYGMGGYGGGYVLGGTNEATLVVNLPEDATLTIDGEQTQSTSANRVFTSPALEQGKEYAYTLKAQVTRDGKVQTATAKVTVRAGEVSQVELKIPATGVAAQ